ncbi:HEAT repeat domain-containing protein [Phormidesmis sp. 146-33]
MAQIIALAAFVALVGGAIFGYSRFEKKNKQAQVVERVQTSLPQSLPPALPVATVEKPQSSYQSPPIADPWEVEETVSDPTPEPMIEAEESRRSSVEDISLPPAIHDPRRPQSASLENISQEVLAWGRSKQLKHLPKLIQYTRHSSPVIRGYAAMAIGEIVSPHRVTTEVEKVIPILGKLTQDSSMQVRLFAIKALGSIQSEKGLPYLQKALVSSSGSVMQAANAAIQKLKLNYGIVAVKPTKKIHK